MRLAFKKKQTDACEQAELTAALYECHQKQEFLRKAVQTLLQFIKEFAFDLKELGSDSFKRDIGVLGEKFDAGKKLRKTQACFHKQEKHIRKFVDRQKNYLAEREKELKDIIDFAGQSHGGP
jgi:diguanylate cyclase